jgi:ABC-type molybdate transport system ATPase subunit
MIYVSHDLSEVERLADVLVLLENGRTLGYGPLDAILPDTRLPIARSPEASVVVEATVRAFDARYQLTELDFGAEVLWVPSEQYDRPASHIVSARGNFVTAVILPCKLSRQREIDSPAG